MVELLHALTYHTRMSAPNPGPSGFLSVLEDTEERRTSDVGHHFGAFMQMGAARGEWLTRKAQTIIDPPSKNPGDVHNGFFAAMLGSAAAAGRIAPRDAAELAIWAYTSPRAPWPGNGDDLLDSRRFDLDTWRAAHAAAVR